MIRLQHTLLVLKAAKLEAVYGAANAESQVLLFTMLPDVGLHPEEHRLEWIDPSSLPSAESAGLAERVDDHDSANVSAMIHVFRIELLAAQRAC